MELIDKVRDIAIEATDGGRDPIAAYLELHRLKTALEESMELCKQAAMPEVSKYGKEGYSADGVNIVVRPGQSRWKFDGVVLHKELSKQLKDVEELAKAAAKTGASIANPDGVLIEPALQTFTADSLVVTKTKN